MLPASMRVLPPKAKTTHDLPATEPATPKTQPAHVVRLRNIRAAIWANDTEFGMRHNVTVSRLYKDDDQQWRTSDSFGRDVPARAHALDGISL